MRAGKSDDSAVIEIRRRHFLIDATAGIARPKAPYKPLEWHEVEERVKEEVAHTLNSIVIPRV